jgi:hypothetical protein
VETEQLPSKNPQSSPVCHITNISLKQALITMLQDIKGSKVMYYMLENRNSSTGSRENVYLYHHRTNGYRKLIMLLAGQPRNFGSLFVRDRKLFSKASRPPLGPSD